MASALTMPRVVPHMWGGGYANTMVRLLKHRFSIGQLVKLAPSKLVSAADGEYEIRQLMPSTENSADSPRYRIKSARETHERIVQENQLATARSNSLFNRK